MYSSLWVSLAAAGLALASFAARDGALDFVYAGFCFFATYFTYTLDRLYVRFSPEDARNRPLRAAWFQKNRTTLAVSVFFAAAFAVLAALNFSAHRLVAIFVFALLCLLYFLPLLWARGRVPPRVFGPGKPFLLALIWTGGTAVIPLLDGNLGREILGIGGVTGANGGAPRGGASLSSERSLFLLADRFSLLLLNAILFDALDRAGDRLRGIRTFAAVHGRSAVLRFSLIGIALWIFFIAVREMNLGSPGRAPEAALPFLFTAFLVLRYARAIRDRKKADAGKRRFFKTYMPHLLDGILLVPILLYFIG